MRIGSVLAAAALVLAACSSDPEPKLTPSPETSAGLDYKPGYKVGRPYKIYGRKYVPKESFTQVQTGIASWYGPGFHGRKTANGERYDQHGITAAHRTLQLPSVVLVTNLSNGKSLIVRVNDRGPYHGNRIIDLSLAGAEALGFRKKGVTKVKVAVLGEESREVARMAKKRGSVGAMNDYVAQLNQRYARTGRVSSGPVAAANGASANEWFLQAGAYSQPDNADLARGRIKSMGPTRIVTRPSGDGTLYLVRLGPYANKDSARQALRQLHDEGFGDAHMLASG